MRCPSDPGVRQSMLRSSFAERFQLSLWCMSFIMCEWEEIKFSWQMVESQTPPATKAQKRCDLIWPSSVFRWTQYKVDLIKSLGGVCKITTSGNCKIAILNSKWWTSCWGPIYLFFFFFLHFGILHVFTKFCFKILWFSFCVQNVMSFWVC